MSKNQLFLQPQFIVLKFMPECQLSEVLSNLVSTSSAFEFCALMSTYTCFECIPSLFHSFSLMPPTKYDTKYYLHCILDRLIHTSCR